MKDVVHNISVEVMEEVDRAFPDVRKGSDLAETLAHISGETGEKFIMIIDEWDALFSEAKEDVRLQEEYIDLLRSLFKSSWTDILLMIPKKVPYSFQMKKCVRNLFLQ